MKFSTLHGCIGLGLTTLALSACGGGGGDDAPAPADSTSSLAAVGQITGFGSVIVNGTRFNTDSCEFEVDDFSASQSDLNVGMVVRVYGSRSDDGTTGHADRIVYDDDLEGPIEALSTSYNGNPDLTLITVLGIDVIVSRTDTKFDDDYTDFDFDSMKVNDVVEVSGYFDNNGRLLATHIEKSHDHDTNNPDDTHVEIKGQISNHLPDARQFNIGSIIVLYDDATDMHELAEHGRQLQNGLFVEVEGRMTDTANTIRAREIEIDDHDLDDDGETSIEGFVSGFTSIENNFFVNGMAVNAANAEFEPRELGSMLTNGMLVEVEGFVNNGVLQAKEVELEDSDSSS